MDIALEGTPTAERTSTVEGTPAVEATPGPLVGASGDSSGRIRAFPESISFGREICGDLTAAESREWLVTNGIGGYASGTVSGLLTRRYHGVLVAALKPPLGRTLLVSKFDETAEYDGAEYDLSANRWADGTISGHGYRHSEQFHLEGTTPVWKFACADALLEKRLFMKQGENSTYVVYRLSRGSKPLTLRINALVNYRDFHGNTSANGWSMNIERVGHGLRVRAYDGAVPFYILSDRAEFHGTHDWYYGFGLAQEQYRGLSAREDHLKAGTFSITLHAGEACTVIATTEGEADLDGNAAFASRRGHENSLLSMAGGESESWIDRLILAADQFIVDRRTALDPGGKSIIAGYHWFGDWGRDTMIALPGLALSTGRPGIARSVLSTFARYADRGMLPNRFPDAGEQPEYNTVDATLWYVEAVRQYVEAANDTELLAELYPVLVDIIAWHRRGTRYGIHVDAADGLLYAGETGVQLTWMDAKIGDWVVTPRVGKPVEVNALWYNALMSMSLFARKLGKPCEEYDVMALQAEKGFQKFWNTGAGYCFDVIDGPDGNDPSLRPNQIIAAALPGTPLTIRQVKDVVDVCGRKLLTSFGLRSLSPDDPRYVGRYGGDQLKRDSAYHQGTSWGWLLGSFALAHYRAYGNPRRALSFLEPAEHELHQHCVGSLSEINDGDPPFTPRGCIAQAWTVGEILRAWSSIRRGR